jgi:hypothetical protein
MSKVNGRQTTSDGKSSHCLWQGELKILFPPRTRNWKVLKDTSCFARGKEMKGA